MASAVTTHDIIGSHLHKLWRDDSLTDVAISHEGEVICQAHQVVVSAFSSKLMQRLTEAVEGGMCTGLGVKWSEPKIKPYKCDVEGCDYAASEMASLRSHQSNKYVPESEKPRELCSVCGVEVLGGKSNLRVHMIQHSEKTFDCTMCDYTTKYKSYIQSHMMRKHGVDETGNAVQKTLQCPHCDFSCYFKHEFNFHMKKHNPDKPFKCKLCSYTATCASVLKYHIRAHTNVKPYKCPICSKSFTRPCQLAKHKRMHAGEKPWKCPQCDRGFAEKRYLEKHVLNIHQGIKPFRCPLCVYACAKKDRMKSHILTNHGAEYLPCDMRATRTAILKVTSFPEEEGVESNTDVTSPGMKSAVKSSKGMTSFEETYIDVKSNVNVTYLKEKSIDVESNVHLTSIDDKNIDVGSNIKETSMQQITDNEPNNRLYRRQNNSASLDAVRASSVISNEKPAEYIHYAKGGSIMNESEFIGNERQKILNLSDVIRLTGDIVSNPDELQLFMIK